MVFAMGVVALSWSLAHFAGCNTIEGAGRDIESAGDAIADTARDAKD
ncbi:MAG: entericidin A/B family lipoprotein [Planctomycetota bacterium]|nr:MAG: entericidin A/B family lipoprotein [Planctomycetota bacterium]